MRVFVKTGRRPVGEGEGLSWWQLDGAGLGRKVFLLWKFADAERLRRVEDGLARLATVLAAAVKTGSQEDAKGDRREEGRRLPGASYLPGTGWDFRICVLLRTRSYGTWET